MDCDTLLLNCLTEIWISDLGFRNQIDWSPKKGLQGAGESEIPLGDPTLVPTEVDDEIEVAVLWVKFTAGG
jgi:hypothetical protein